MATSTIRKQNIGTSFNVLASRTITIPLMHYDTWDENIFLFVGIYASGTIPFLFNITARRVTDSWQVKCTDSNVSGEVTGNQLTITFQYAYAVGVYMSKDDLK